MDTPATSQTPSEFLLETTVYGMPIAQVVADALAFKLDIDRDWFMTEGLRLVDQASEVRIVGKWQTA